MSPFFTFAKTNTKKHNSLNKQRVFSKLNFKKKLPVFFIALFVLLAGIYLFQANDLVIKGFTIKKLEEKISEIGQDNKNLEIKTTELQSLSSIEEIKKEFNMVKAEKMEYISSAASVAIKK